MTAIGVTIFVLFAFGCIAHRKGWHLAWLVAMMLEVEAMKARDRGKGRDPSRYERPTE